MKKSLSLMFLFILASCGSQQSEQPKNPNSDIPKASNNLADDSSKNTKASILPSGFDFVVQNESILNDLIQKGSMKVKVSKGALITSDKDVSDVTCIMRIEFDVTNGKQVNKRGNLLNNEKISFPEKHIHTLSTIDHPDNNWTLTAFSEDLSASIICSWPDSTVKAGWTLEEIQKVFTGLATITSK